MRRMMSAVFAMRTHQLTARAIVSGFGEVAPCWTPAKCAVETVLVVGTVLDNCMARLSLTDVVLASVATRRVCSVAKENGAAHMYSTSAASVEVMTLASR